VDLWSNGVPGRLDYRLLAEIEGVAPEAAIASIHLIERRWETLSMAKRQTKAPKQVVSIEAYRQARTKGVGGLTSQILAGRWYGDFIRKDWSTLLVQLKTEKSQIDRAILALTKLAKGRGQLILNQTDASERKQAQR
jgi:hypothetical protein